ncbi:hypothetical protein [Aureimonas populi]|uniref:Uncharacterized protein n=1 Tax=Aureimonas populi TaxID=1701758 RepID=A0ABW5CKL3_9HYPH|nr:hypothetical protein [Aureimonas populi]
MAALLRTETASPAGRTVLAFPGCPTAQRLGQEHGLSEAQAVELDRLRWLALRARLAPKPDLERACFLLAGGQDGSLSRFSNAFFRGLADGAIREMCFYRPGTRRPSDDEIWLIRLVGAWRAGEEKAAAALVSWRVRPAQRRWMRFLSAGLVRALDGRN